MSGFYYDDDGNVRSYADDAGPRSAGRSTGDDAVQVFHHGPSSRSLRDGDESKGSEAAAGGGKVGWGGTVRKSDASGRPIVTYEDMTAIEPIALGDVGDEMSGRSSRRRGAGGESKHAPGRSTSKSPKKSSPLRHVSTNSIKRVFSGWGGGTPTKKEPTPKKKKSRGGGWKFWRRKKSAGGAGDTGSASRAAMEAANEGTIDVTIRTFSGKSLR